MASFYSQIRANLCSTRKFSIDEDKTPARGTNIQTSGDEADGSNLQCETVKQNYFYCILVLLLLLQYIKRFSTCVFSGYISDTLFLLLGLRISTSGY